MRSLPREKTAHKLEWQRNMRRRFVEANGFSTAANYANGGARKAVLERDGYRCVDCGMTDAEHKAAYSRPITVDHKDKNRRNNTMGNLQTLCLRCHGSKDITPALKAKALTPEQIIAARKMRTEGATFQKIADHFGVNISTAWSHITKGESHE